ncbi:MAG: sterol desaturase family protein [Gammaproteobacteria bacterium]|nr:sterol desaturase family protein [Gammaproteobacteria bacterium]
MDKKTPYPHIRLFKSNFLEYFSYVHPLSPMLLYFPLCSIYLMMGYGHWAYKLMGIVLGLFAWTLIEYLFHRFLYHFVAHAPRAQRFNYIIHGIHHDDPRDAWRGVAPMVMSLGILALLAPLFMILVPAQFFCGFFVGFIVGYVFYEYSHYVMHHHPHQHVYFKKMRKHHFLHHFKDTRMNFGVTTTFWDQVFRTKMTTVVNVK